MQIKFYKHEVKEVNNINSLTDTIKTDINLSSCYLNVSKITYKYKYGSGLVVATTAFIFVAKKLFSFVCWENLKLYFWFIQWRRETCKYSWFEQVPTENIDKSIDYGANKHFVIFTFPRFAGHICIWIFDILMVFTGLGPAGAANQIIDRDKGPMRSQTEIRSYGAGCCSCAIDRGLVPSNETSRVRWIVLARAARRC